MTTTEFSREFDIRFNYVNSNLAYSINDYEKSVYLTRAQEEILDNYFNPRGNKYQEGYDMSEKRHIDFSSITKISSVSLEKSGVTTYSPNGIVFEIADDVFKILGERFKFTKSNDAVIESSVFPISVLQYQKVLTKSYKNPPKRQSWRLIRSGDTLGKIIVEIIPQPGIDKSKPYEYVVKYILRPTPIVVANLTGGLTVNGIGVTTECMLSPEIHDEILNRAIEICRIDYIGDAQGQIQLNQRSE